METTATATTFSTTSVFDRLHDAISTRHATFGVIGLGYVGLPLGTSFATVGFNVLGFDVNPATVDTLNMGTSHIKDVASGTIADLVQAERFAATTDMSRLAEADIISICVPTPLSKTRDPDMSYVAAATAQIAHPAPRSVDRAREHHLPRHHPRDHPAPA